MLYYLAKGFVYLIQKQSRDFCIRTGEGFGSLLWNLGYRKKVILRNLDIAFPDKPLDWKLQVGKKSLRNIGRVLFELPKIPQYIQTKEIEKIFFLEEGKELIRRGSKGKILISAHIGNWELAGAGLSHFFGNMVSLAYRMKNKKLNDFLTKIRNEVGVEIIFHNQSLKDFIKALDEGKILTFLADQNALRERGIFVDFFGLPASTITFPAKLALRYNKDILFGYIWFDEKEKVYRGKFREINFEKLGNMKEDLKNLVQAYTKEIEKAVREHPEQYFWVHKRWKTRPEGQPENIYD